MAESKQGPVIRECEQLVLIVSQDYAHRPNKRWHGTLELERKEYATYADILHVADDRPETITKVLRVCMSTGHVDDITSDVLEAAEALEAA